LMAARDLSVMNTPPPNRHPVETEIVPFNEEIIRDAIIYEIQRGGQVYFINNRVENITEVAGMIQRLVPDAKVGVGHGQMEGRKLESVMLDFMEGEFDVLVATTIVESGLDISNANTIFINNAHHFGLSDLHQMRGRVGRSNKKAFAYMICPPTASLTPEARKRMTALEQFSGLGSGFNISMRDLEIRGAGDLLGGEQSGFISDLGFDAYQKILAEAVDELKENEFKELYKKTEHGKKHSYVRENQLDTDLEILIPDNYINTVSERLKLYQELNQMKDDKGLKAFEEALLDRFGPIPTMVHELLDSMRLRWIARDLGFEKLILKKEKLIGHFVTNPQSDFYQSPIFGQFLEFLKHNHRYCEMKERNNKLTFVYENVKSIKEAIAVLDPILAQTI
jgi:transcription-repair coupling factor (superfamily II helicase)